MRSKATSDVWWKNAVLYCLPVQCFLDADGDGRGDLQGLTDRLDYLSGIGVTCLWLMPFHPSPGRDDGYDISDFYGVHPELGTHGDFAEMLRTARDRGIRVIADLVMNHTSDQHPWFQAARADRDSPYRDFYVWVDEKPEEKPGDIVFPDQESSNWTWDDEAGQYYLHRFYSFQPDLNVANPQVRDEIAQVVGFWLDQGLSGFRVDAVPFMLEPMGMPEGALQDPHELLRDLRRFLSRRAGEAILMGEVNLDPEAAARVLRRRGRRRAAHGPELQRQPGAVPRARARAGGAARRRPARAPADPRGLRSGPTSCATTTSSPWTSSATRSAPRSSPRSAPRSAISSTGAACAAGCRRCSAATRTASVSPTASRSRCRARRSSSTARRSGWPRTSTSRGA